MSMNKTETSLAVSGITCPSCVRSIERALLALDGVTHVVVHRLPRHGEGHVLVEHFAGRPTQQALIAELFAAGYAATLAPRPTAMSQPAPST